MAAKVRMINLVVYHVFDVVEWDKAAQCTPSYCSPFQLWRARLPFHCPNVLCELLSIKVVLCFSLQVW